MDKMHLLNNMLFVSEMIPGLIMSFMTINLPYTKKPTLVTNTNRVIAFSDSVVSKIQEVIKRIIPTN